MLCVAVSLMLSSPLLASTHQSYPGHGDLGQANLVGYFAFKQDPREDGRYTDKLRVFIPPGTTSIDIGLYTRTSSFPVVCMGYQNPPSSCSVEGDSRNLFDFLAGKKITCTNMEGRDQLILDRFSPALTQEQAGWLYIKIPENSWNNVQTGIFVDREIYNNWYNSINWETDVEAGYYPDGTPPAPPPPSETYSLTTVLGPEEVRAEGRWRLTSGPDTAWKSCSATVANLPQGSYSVEFRDVPGWTRPAARSVNIISSNVQITGTYSTAGSTPGDEEHLSYPGHQDLGLSNAWGTFLINQVHGQDNYADKLRVFIPPGTTKASVNINTPESSNPVSCIRYQNTLGTCSSDSEHGPKGLFYYIDERTIHRSASSTVRAVDDIPPSPLTIDQAGWLYIRIEGEWHSVTTNISVNRSVYDEWYNSIDWQNDVEAGYRREDDPPTEDPDYVSTSFLQSIYLLLLNDDEQENQITEQID